MMKQRQLLNIVRPNMRLNYHFTIFYVLVIFATLSFYRFDKMWLDAYLVHAFIAVFGIGFGYHRLIIHRVIDTYSWVTFLSGLVGALANTGSPINWGMSHYLHHLTPDSHDDPHSPIHGWKVLAGYYKVASIEQNKDKVFRAIRPIVQNKSICWIHNYYYLILIGFYVLTFMVGGLKGLVFWGLVPSGLSYLTILFTNYFNHAKWGYRNFDTRDKSKNVWFLFPLNFGENWHNNHHQYPSHWTTMQKWWELDPPALLCLLFRRDIFRYLKLKFSIWRRAKVNKQSDYVY